jgi:hypothetical protein
MQNNSIEPSDRVKLLQNRCVICGAPSTCSKGHLFYQTGRSKYGTPFCKEHAEHFGKYATPVFENKRALELFKYMFPRTYGKNVEGKPIIYFDTFKHKHS